MMSALDEHSTYTEDFIEGMEFGIKTALQSQQGSVNQQMLEALESIANIDNYIWVKNAQGKDMIQWNGEKDLITTARKALELPLVSMKMTLEQVEQAITNAESSKQLNAMCHHGISFDVDCESCTFQYWEEQLKNDSAKSSKPEDSK